MGGYAWVTLATNDSYSLGALVLANSLKQVGTKQQLAVLITPGVTNSMREKLSQVFDIVQEVNVLDSKDEANLRLLKRPELGITFTKLHCWRLTQFDKCVFLDADTLVLEYCDELFEREELSAAPDVGWPDCFNSGVFVYRPSNQTYEKLIQFALERGSFDGGDQGLLNLYFSDWAHKDISKHLPFIYNLCSTAGYSYLPAFKQYGGNAKIVHFIGATKPWLQFFDTESKTVRPTGEAQHLQDVLQRWWNIFCTLIHPNLTPDMTPSNTDTTHGSPPNIPQSSHHVYQHFLPQPEVHNPAENYQNVWDPWEEYDYRQAQNQNSQSNSNFVTYPPPLQEHHDSQHNDSFQQTNEHFAPHSHFHQPFENQNQHFDGHHQSSEIHHQHIENHNQPFDSLTQPFENRHEPHESHNMQSHDRPWEGHTNSDHTHSFNVPESHSFESNQQNQLVESHNTNAYSDAGHHDSRNYRHDPVQINSHSYHPPTPTYIRPQNLPQGDPIPHSNAHYKPPPEKSTVNQLPPPQQSHPRLPVECVATTTVSNDITLHTSTNEDSNEKYSGLAGAFAQLTLGVPRTAEQAALDDHLRRQGWEVGNIDYLGRDSFENIWSKICETLSSETAPQPKDPSSPATEDAKAPEEPPAAVTTEQKPAPELPVPKETEIKPEPVKEEPVVTDKLEGTESKESVVPAAEATAPVPETLISDESSITPQSAAQVPAPEVVQAGDIPKPADSVPTAPVETPIIKSSTPPPVLTSSKPESVPSVIPETPKPTIEVIAAVESPNASTTGSEIPKPTPVVTPESPKPTDIVPESPIPAPEIPKPASEIPTEATTLPETPSTVPETATAPQTQSPATTESLVPDLRSSEVALESPKVDEESSKVAPETPKVDTDSPKEPPKTPKVVPEEPKAAPETPEIPKSPEVVPESPKLTSESSQITELPKEVPESPKVVPEISKTLESPEVAPGTPKSSETPKVAPETPIVVPESPKAGSETPIVVPESPKVTPKAPESPKVVPESPKVAPETPKAPDSPKIAPESSKPESTPQVCPIAPKSAAEKKSGKKVPKEAPQPPKAEVTEATPPTTPVSPQPKQSKQQALVVEASVPDTPPPASSEASGATPTPPPRKSSGTPKKAGAKTKK